MKISACFGVLITLGLAGISPAQAAVSLETAKRVAEVTRTYAYPDNSWGAWLKPRLRYLARQCSQLASKELPARELDKALALASAKMEVDDVLWVTEAEGEHFSVPADYRTPDELSHVCELLATHKLRPGCWPTLSGEKSPYKLGLSCALVTTGSLDQGIQRFAPQPIAYREDWFANKIPRDGLLALKAGEEAELKLAVPQVEGSEWVSPPQKEDRKADFLAKPVPLETHGRKAGAMLPQTLPVAAVPAKVQPVVPVSPITALPLPVLPPAPGGHAAVPGLVAQPAVATPPAASTTVSRPPELKAKTVTASPP